MKLIAFLGTTDYKTTTFVWNEQTKETQFFPVAAAHFIKPDQVLVCATPTVQAHKNLPELTRQLDAAQIPCQVLPIPEGHSEGDLWKIFEVLTNAVAEDEHVVFDLTHSLRSLPFLSFLAVAYLQAAKKVQVEKVLYGAWDARDQATNRSPVFDLTPFVRLLDWLVGTERFVETGDGQVLANLLRAGMPPGIQMRDNMTARTLGHQLKSAAEAIESVSLALRVTRPIETMQSAAQLAATLDQALPGIQQRAKPFDVLAHRVVQEYGQFAVENPTDPQCLNENLRRQLQMIEWYLKRELVVQAATLAREWVVSVIALKLGEPLFDYDRGRRDVEAALNNATEIRRKEPRSITPSRLDTSFEKLAFVESTVKLWSNLTNLRNDIAHVGMKLSPQPASLLKQKTHAIYSQLLILAGETING